MQKNNFEVLKLTLKLKYIRFKKKIRNVRNEISHIKAYIPVKQCVIATTSFIVGVSIPVMLLNANNINAAEPVKLAKASLIPAPENIEETVISQDVAINYLPKSYVYETTKQWKVYMNLPDATKQLFTDICSKYEVNEAFILGICYNESKFNPSAINRTNEDGTTDWGIGQCNDKTLSFFQKRLGISSMEEILNEEVGIEACCALYKYYKDMGFSDEDALLAYQEGIGNFNDVKANLEAPWPAYKNVLANAEIYNYLLNYEEPENENASVGEEN